MKRLFLYLLLTSYFTCSGQADRPVKAENVYRLIESLPKVNSSYRSDTQRIELNLQLSRTLSVSEIDSAIRLLQQNLTLSRSINWEKGISNNLYEIGYLHIGKNDILEGVEYIYESLTIAESYDNQPLIARCYRTLGDAYAILGDYNKSELYLNKSVKIYQAIGDNHNYLISLNNLGLCYDDAGKYELAISTFENCVAIAKKKSLNNLYLNFLINLGYAYMHANSYQKANNCLKEAYERVSKSNRLYLENQITLTLADNLNYLNKNETSFDYLSKSKILCDKLKNDNAYKYYHEVAYRVFKDKEPRKALYHHEKFIQLKEEASALEYQQKIGNLQAKFDNRKKGAELQLLNQEYQQEVLFRRIAIGAVFIFLILSYLIWNSRLKLARKKKEIEAANVKVEGLNRTLEQRVLARTLELSNANEELLSKNKEISEALFKGQSLERERISSELHDNLGSMISSISWRLQAIDPQNLNDKERKVFNGIREMAKSAYADVRNLSHNLLPKHFREKGLTGSIQDLINDLNNANGIYFNFIYSEFEDLKNKNVELNIYAIVMELINNILKHSMAKNATIEIRKSAKQAYELHAFDDGVGIRNEGELSLFNLRKRADAISSEVQIIPQAVGSHIIIAFSDRYNG